MCPPGCEWSAANFGQVPAYALSAGVDKGGETLYVGRAFHEGDVVPAKVVPSHGGAYVPWGGAEHKKDYYEVLCLPPGRGQVSWVARSGGAVPDNAVSIGTTTSGERLFVGRVFHDGTITPGKVRSRRCMKSRASAGPRWSVLISFLSHLWQVHGSHGCCYIPYGGKELRFPEYEVLVIS